MGSFDQASLVQASDLRRRLSLERPILRQENTLFCRSFYRLFPHLKKERSCRQVMLEKNRIFSWKTLGFCSDLINCLGNIPFCFSERPEIEKKEHTLYRLMDLLGLSMDSLFHLRLNRCYHLLKKG